MTAAPRRPTALVTGASSGIGRALAELLAADGFDLVLVARREERLRELAGELERLHGTHSLVVAIDLSTPDAPAAIANHVSSEGREIDALVNNAGFGSLGAFAERPLSVDLAMIQVNVACLTALTRLFLPGMLARRRGRILNVSSTAAFQPGPFMAVYYATKAYVQSFSEALAAEVAGSGVTVTALAPGPTRSEFPDVAGINSAAFFRSPLVPDAISVARAGHRAMMSGRRTVVPGLANRLGAQAYRFLPRRWLTAIIGVVQRGRG
jgi:short-subunit dehydrogenase